jgi:hypothetical protein
MRSSKPQAFPPWLSSRTMSGCSPVLLAYRKFQPSNRNSGLSPSATEGICAR